MALVDVELISVVEMPDLANVSDSHLMNVDMPVLRGNSRTHEAIVVGHVNISTRVNEALRNGQTTTCSGNYIRTAVDQVQ